MPLPTPYRVAFLLALPLLACGGPEMSRSSRQQIDGLERSSFGSLDPQTTIADLESACQSRSHAVVAGRAGTNDDPAARALAEGLLTAIGVKDALRGASNLGTRDTALVDAGLDKHFRSPGGTPNPAVALLTPLSQERLDFVIVSAPFIEERELEAAATDWCGRTGRKMTRAGAAMRCENLGYFGNRRFGSDATISNIIVAYDCVSPPDAPGRRRRGR